MTRYKKGKTNLDFSEARDSEWQWHQLGHMQICTLLQTNNHASTSPLSFYRPDALPAAQPTASSLHLSIHTVTPAKSDGNSDENDRLVTLITPSVSSVVVNFCSEARQSLSAECATVKVPKALKLRRRGCVVRGMGVPSR